jgi:hypothetical protein
MARQFIAATVITILLVASIALHFRSIPIVAGMIVIFGSVLFHIAVRLLMDWASKEKE